MTLYIFDSDANAQIWWRNFRRYIWQKTLYGNDMTKSSIHYTVTELAKYNAKYVSYDNSRVEFETEADATLFLLRWS